MSQIEITKPFKLDPETEKQRSESDLLFISRNPQLYWGGRYGEDFWKKEEEAWERWLRAHGQEHLLRTEDVEYQDEA